MSGFQGQSRGGGRGASSGRTPGGRGDGGGGRGHGGRGGGDGFGGRSYHGGGEGRGRGAGGRGHESGGFSGQKAGGGGGRGGANPHIGESSSIQAATRSPAMSDQAILAVVNPPAAARTRDALTTPTQVTRPSRSAAREGPSIGTKFGPTGAMIVTSNHFQLDTSRCPNTITQYHVHLYRVGRDGHNSTEDIAAEEDTRKTVQLMRTLRAKHPEWTTPPKGFAYDTKSALFTTRDLGLADVNTDGQPFHSEVVGMLDKNGAESSVSRYRITLTEVNRNVTGTDRLRALEIAVLMYGRWDVVLDQPTWSIVSNSVYTGADCGDIVKPLTPSGHLLAKQGWFASLKPCQAGPMLVVDLACCAFLASGNMVELLVKMTGCRDVNELQRLCSGPGGLSRHDVDNINAAIAKLKVKVNHLGFWKVARRLGPVASSKDSEFEHEGKMYTVEKYYALKAKSDPRYRALKYPHLPTINMGSETRKELYPAELVDVPAGQPRNRLLKEDPKLCAEMIKYAAVRPAERMQHITQHPQSVVNVLGTDSTAAVFGLNCISTAPTQVAATILPPAKLQYGRNQVLEPGLKGSWSADFPRKVPLYQAPPAPVHGGYPFAVVLISGGQPPRELEWQSLLDTFRDTLVADSNAVGVPLVYLGIQKVCRADTAALQVTFDEVKSKCARIVLVVLVAEGAYGTVKLVSDQMALPTQCIKWAKLAKAPRGIHYNVLLKMNFKLGGTSHVLASRLPSGAQAAAGQGSVFQSPPASLSWIFDRPCMLVGIDVSHPEPGMQRESMAAVVGSVDGSATKYVAHISAQTGRQEMVSALTEAMDCLFKAFRARQKNRMPETVIVYRDGVSEGQYDQVLQVELPQIQEAIAQQGYQEGAVRVVVVVCTKGHRTRLVCQENGTAEYVNPCPGLVVDSAITSENLNEFYLNSHAAIQGTSKPCRYTLLYDELGIKMSELQLLTYWTTYLYARCNKSVSYVTPAYYAHWASKRGKELLSAGASATQLRQISDTCARVDSANNMFFL